MERVIRVLQFADVINRNDFIDVIVQRADPERFELGTCVRSKESNIADPVPRADAQHWTIEGTSRSTLPRTVWQLARLLREWNVDILHTHHYEQAFIGWLATRLHRKTRLVIGRHYSDAIQRIPRWTKRRALLGVEQVANRAASRIIVPSVCISDILVTRQGISSDKIDIIPYGFEQQKYSTPPRAETLKLRRELGVDGHFVLGTFARLHEEKGHRFLLDALVELGAGWPGVSLLLLGEGSERARLERQIETSGLSGRVKLLGWRRDAMTVMAAVDAVVQPTLHEAFSQVMVEALWMRKPLVITAVSGAVDIIRDGETGLLVPRGDKLALARAIERIAGDPGLRNRLSATGRAYVENNLCVTKVIPRYEEAYCRALGR